MARLWAEAGLGEQLHELALDAYDRMIDLDLAEVSADGVTRKALCARLRLLAANVPAERIHLPDGFAGLMEHLPQPQRGGEVGEPAALSAAWTRSAPAGADCDQSCGSAP